MPVARVPFYLPRLSRIIRGRYEAIIIAPLIAGFFLSAFPPGGTIFATRTFASSGREFDHVNGTRRPRWIDRTQINIRELVIAEPAVFSSPRRRFGFSSRRLKRDIRVYNRDRPSVYPCRCLRCYLSRRFAAIILAPARTSRYITYITREIVRFASRTAVSTLRVLSSRNTQSLHRLCKIHANVAPFARFALFKIDNAPPAPLPRPHLLPSRGFTRVNQRLCKTPAAVVLVVP